MRIVAAVDKFRGTLDARLVAEAIAAACSERHVRCDQVPLADGGEGTLDAFGGANRSTVVTGPDGSQIEAAWRFDGIRAVIEMARAAGLQVAGGAGENDPVAATTRGVGELIVAAVLEGAQRVIVGLGGSATTDGGVGAICAMEEADWWSIGGRADLVVACDVDTLFGDAARVFGTQKGATPGQIEILTKRLEDLGLTYRAKYGVDVTMVPGSGAAGGLAGALLAIGARTMSGFDLVAAEVELSSRIASADLVITGEGLLDPTSRTGKVVGGVALLCERSGVDVHAIAGAVRDVDWIEHTSLVESFGEFRALNDTAACVSEATSAILAARTSA